MTATARVNEIGVGFTGAGGSAAVCGMTCSDPTSLAADTAVFASAKASRRS